MTTALANRYELGEVIGRGGMAEVRAGHDLRLDRPVAVKLLRSDIAHQAGVRQRFESEARLAARLFHPNVVAVFDSGETDEGVPFIVMERLSGQTLYDRLGRGTLSVGEARDLARQVLAALDAAHAAGILHRDVKPGNILVGSESLWKVGDFGIAKAVLDATEDPTVTVALLGTPAYLAPERLHGSAATVASDLYSVGVVLYETLTGRKPLETPLLVARPDVDTALAAAIDRCLAPAPDRRFASASEMAAAIGLAGPAAGVPATTEVLAPPPGAAAASRAAVLPPTPTVVAPPGPPTDILPRAAVTSRVPFSTRTRAMGALVVGIVVALAVILALSASHGGAPTTTITTTRTPATTRTSATGGLPAGLAHALKNLDKLVQP